MFRTVFDASVIDPAYPDYDLIRQIVQEAIAPPPAGNGEPAEPSAPETTDPAAPTTAAAPAADVSDACAYDPAQAEAALAEGEPETRNG